MSSMVNEVGKNHIKFSKLSQRLQKVNVDIIHRVRSKGGLDTHLSAVPETGERGCHFQDELERCKGLDPASSFKRFYYAISPLCQSLPELYHHIANVVDMLDSQLSRVTATELSSFMQLTSVLARDMQDDLWPYFHRLFNTLTQRVNSVINATPGTPSPELTGQLFECLSYIIKYTLTKLADNHDTVRQYYGLLLGHNTPFVRDMSARCFVLLLRKLKPAAYSTHVKKLLKALAGQLCSCSDVVQLPILALESKREQHGGSSGEDDSANAPPPRMQNLIEGVSALLYYTSRGIKGCIHSKGAAKLTLPLDFMVPLSLEAALEVAKLCKGSKKLLKALPAHLQSAFSSKDKNVSKDGFAKNEALSFASGQVMSLVVVRLFRHVHPSNMSEPWLRIADSISALIPQIDAVSCLSDCPPSIASCVESAALHCAEILIWCLTHSKGRGLSDKKVKQAVAKPLIKTALDLVESIFNYLSESVRISSWCGGRGTDTLTERTRILFCRVWLAFPRDSTLISRIDGLLARGLKSLTPTPAVLVLSSELLSTLPADVVQRHLVRPTLDAVVNLVKTDQGSDQWLVIFIEILFHLKDVRRSMGIISNANDGTAASRRKENAGPKVEWSDMDYVNEESGSEASSDDDDDGEAFKKLVKGCSKELLLLAGHAADVLHSATKTTGGNSGVMACMVLRWFAIACPAGLHEQLVSMKSYSSILHTSLKALTGSLDNFSKQVGPRFLSYLVVFLCAESERKREASILSSQKMNSIVCKYAEMFVAVPCSLSFTWGLLELLGRMEGSLVEVVPAHTREAMIEKIATAMNTSSYWLRQSLLRIAAYFPPPPLLDDPSEPQNEPQTVDLISLLLEAASISPDLRTEREYMRRMGSLEVLVRGRRLPELYVTLSCSFCLSMLHTKFQPFWEPTIAVLVAAAGYNEGENVLWPLLLQSIIKLGQKGDDVEEVEDIDEKAVQKDLKKKVTAKIAGDEENDDDEDDEVGDEISRPYLHQCILSLLQLDSGEVSIPLTVASSKAFFYKLPDLSDALVEPDTRVDHNTAYQSAWSILKKVPSITLRRSKVVVPMFLSFLTKQYFAVFSDDPEVPWLKHIGLFDESLCAEALTLDTSNGAALSEPKMLSLKTLKTRLRMFLQVFSQVSGPKGLYQHELLYSFYIVLSSNPESSLAGLAIDCLATYKPVFLMPFKDNIKRLLDDKTMRDELVTFNISSVNAVIDPRHRPDLIPLVTRVVFGRFAARARSSRASKEQSLSRRAAVLAFLSSLDVTEQVHLVQLMYRTLVPRAILVSIPPLKTHKTQQGGHVTIASQCDSWYAHVQAAIDALGSADLNSVSWERQTGFLHLLQQVIKILGFSVTRHIPSLCKIVVLMLTNAQSVRGNLEDEDEVEDKLVDEDAADDFDLVAKDEAAVQTSHSDNSHSLRVRTLCLMRLAELIHQYHAVFNFKQMSADILRPLASLLMSMPTSIAGSTKPPSLLKILHALVQYDETVSVVENNAEIVKTVIKCVGSRCDFEVAKVVMGIITKLLETNNGDSVLPHAPLIIASFSKRFVGAGFDEIAELKLSELVIVPSGSVKQELGLLCRIAEGMFSRSDVLIDSRTVTNLATLLLGMLRTYTTNKKIRVEESWVGDILRIYKTIMPRMDDVAPHVAFISRLFGPAGHSQSLFNNSSIRSILASVYVDLSRHPSMGAMLVPSAAAITNLVKVDSTLLGRDFGTCMPIFQTLAADDASPMTLSMASFGGIDIKADQNIEFLGWATLLGYPGSPRDGNLCTVVLFECLRCMWDEEMVVRGAAIASVKRLIQCIADWDRPMAVTDEKRPVWSDLLLASLMPALRKGLKESPDMVKKGFISILSHAISTLGKVPTAQMEPFFHADLQCLQHEDPEQDFFENITHIQSHRRVRAMMKLRLILKKCAPILTTGQLDSPGESMDVVNEEPDDDGPDAVANDDAMLVDTEEAGDVSLSNFTFSSTSLVHVLLPLAFHPLFSDEFVKKDHNPLMHEACSFLGAIALHLPWAQYFAQIKVILKQLDKGKQEKEKILLVALCSVLDAFHFDMSGEEEATGLNVPTERGVIETVISEEEKKDETIDKQENDEPAKNQPLPPTGTNISRVVIDSVIPWVQVFLLKAEKDHKGQDSKVVRTGIVVALSKLICRLQPPVVPEKKKGALFINLVIRVVDTLKSRDTSARDQARESLSKMLMTMGISYLQPIIYEMQHSLTLGYQRHVCNYTLRALLTTVSDTIKYAPPLDAVCVPLLADSAERESIVLTKPVFDECIPMIMQSVMDDLNGEALVDREAEGAVRQTIREAKGSKANEILEITARILLFRPSFALQCADNPASVSSLHALSVPMLEALGNCEEADLIGRINEGLQRVAMGLSKNSSLVDSELLLYLHATLEPFVAAIIREYEQHKRSLGMLNTTIRQESSNNGLIAGGCGIGGESAESFADDLPSYLREESSDEEEAALYSKPKQTKNDVTGYRANTWLPSDQRSHDQKAAIEERNREKRERDQVLDGASAPKLTGHNRHKAAKSKSSGNSAVGGGSDPAAIVAVRFCLTLFIGAIKKNQLNSASEETRAMCIPFIPLLGQCLRLPGAAQVVALAMRCLCSLLTWNLPVDPSFGRAVGARMMKLMFRGGVLLSTDNDLVQACIRGLTGLFSMYNECRKVKLEIKGRAEKASKGSKRKHDARDVAILPTEADASIGDAMPLSEQNVRALLQMMTLSIMEVTSSYQNAAFALIKAIIDARIVVPEVYDLITKLTEQIVLSQRKGVRDSSGAIVVEFMTHYPLGDKRLHGHMKQLITNCSYEYEDGRQASLETLLLLCKYLPVITLEDHAQMIFLPMTLRLVNDASSSCRQSAAAIVTTVARRVSGEMYALLLEYVVKWVASGEKGLIRTGAQCVGLLVIARPDLMKKANSIPTLVSHTCDTLKQLDLVDSDANSKKGSLEKREMALFDEGLGESGGTEAWAVIYHIMVMIETLYVHLPSAVDSAVTHYGQHEHKTAQSNNARGSQGQVLVMEIVQEAMLYPHAWVRAAAARVLRHYLQRRDVARAQLSVTPTGQEILLQPNALYHLTRRLCVVLNQPVLAEGLVEAVSFSLVFVVRAMYRNPDLAEMPLDAARDAEEKQAGAPDDQADADTEDDENDAQDESDDDNEDEDEEEQEETVHEVKSDVRTSTRPSGTAWAMQRLRGLGLDSRGNRRLFVIRVFRLLLATITKHEEQLVREHLAQMIEVAMRAHLTISGPDLVALKALKELAGSLMDELEAKVGSSVYIGVFSEVQRRLQTARALKKRAQALDAVTNPVAFAMAKVIHPHIPIFSSLRLTTSIPFSQIAKRKRDAESKKRKQSKGGKKPSKRSKNAAIVYED